MLITYIYIPNNNDKGSPLSTCLPAFGGVGCFAYYSHPDKREMI